ncbi:MFS general substrate transporter [Aaosphaeria arxii CBS 175.79]|uniref:MFS general substrate transporter n=1 Tax=Aaosphaeria arxii CBS 175.79 TaxID=1450172 RepID=A0A6A5XZE2_9PLEO|nr:MFS general substrate transporter [Aaosphaeria arxii CBS 175.79]KAF2018000.1 MFS general substrate transporter [Aaosphaeria arxii CBS 175.79]
MADVEHVSDAKATVLQVEGVENNENRIQDVLPSYGKPWFRIGFLVKLNAQISVLLLTSFLSGFDGSMLNGVQSLPVWQEDFNHPTGSSLGLLSTMQTVGLVVSMPFAPYVTDHVGRRHPVFFSSAICILGASLQSASWNVGSFIAGRFLLGFGTGFVASGAAPLLAELSYPTHRVLVSGLYNTTWYLGAIVAAWSTYGSFRMPNSWRRKEKARQVLVNSHAGGDENSPLVEFELAEIISAIEEEQKRNTKSWLSFFNSRANIWRLSIVVTLGLMVQWSGSGLVSFYLILVLKSIGITDPETQNTINGGLQIYNYATAILGAFLLDRFGRRTMMLLSTCGMAVAFLIWTVLSAVNEERGFDSKYGVGVVLMIFIFYFFYNVAMNPIAVLYILEVLPFTLRAKRMTINGMVGMGAAVFNGFVNPIALEAMGWKWYLVFFCLIVLWIGVVYFLYPETKGMSLEEITDVFEGPDSRLPFRKQKKAMNEH